MTQFSRRIPGVSLLSDAAENRQGGKSIRAQARGRLFGIVLDIAV